MSDRLHDFFNANHADIEAALRARLPVSSLPATNRLNDALEYALFPGGKRLRPALSLLASTLVRLPRAEALTIACAIEFLHSSSLVIDDLPGMDDAVLRRNRPALHLVFGESTALLVALALLNQSYALCAKAARSCGGMRAVERLVSEVSSVVGTEGMIGGQMLDLELKAGSTNAQGLAGRDLKTVALMRLTLTAGALAAGANEEDTRALRTFGECSGRAYQICDDLLDEVSDEVTGKTSGQDSRHGRASAVNTLGIFGARVMSSEFIERGTHALTACFGRRGEVELLADAARYIVDSVPHNALVEADTPTVHARCEAAAAGD